MNLFGQTSVDDLFSEITKKLIDQIKNEYTPQVDREEYINYLVSEYEMEELIAEKERVTRNETEIEIRGMPGIKITVLIPFSGPDYYFSYKPSSYTIVRDINIYRLPGDLYTLRFDQSFELNNQRINYNLEMAIGYILSNIQSFNRHIQGFNNNLRKKIENLLDKRDAILSKFDEVSKRINIPLRKRGDAPPNIPLKRKKIRITIPKVKEQPVHPYSTLAIKDYEEILEVCSYMGIAMERSPRAFDTLEEEQIRDFFLVMLNAFFRGEATGETFNRSGKTDILVRHENNNVLIVECKIWKGKHIVKDSINQLFEYITWRDTKTGVFIFYKRKKKPLTKVIEEIRKEVNEHENFGEIFNFSNQKLKNENFFGYKFKHPLDAERTIYLGLMIFDIHPS
ncbi:MAG: hypothetical protein ACFFAI_03300 [Promethearchaeota archaeon]